MKPNLNQEHNRLGYKKNNHNKVLNTIKIIYLRDQIHRKFRNLA